MREKIKLLSSAGTGTFYVTTKNKRQGPQARLLQGNEDQVMRGRAGSRLRRGDLDRDARAP